MSTVVAIAVRAPRVCGTADLPNDAHLVVADYAPPPKRTKVNRVWASTFLGRVES